MSYKKAVETERLFLFVPTSLGSSLDNIASAASIQQSRRDRSIPVIGINHLGILVACRGVCSHGILERMQGVRIQAGTYELGKEEKAFDVADM